MEMSLTDVLSALKGKEHLISQFEQDVLSSVRASDRCSEKQLNVLRSAAKDVRAKDKEVKVAPGIAELFALFASAKGKLQYPKIRILTARTRLVLQISKSGDTIYVNDRDLTQFISYANKERKVTYGCIRKWGMDQMTYNGQPIPDVQEAIEELLQGPVDSLKLAGQKIGTCCFCGLDLTTRESVTAGYGPICAEKWGLPWGQLSLPEAS